MRVPGYHSPLRRVQTPVLLRKQRPGADTENASDRLISTAAWLRVALPRVAGRRFPSLTKPATLRHQGILDDGEFEILKAQLLAGGYN